MSKRGEVLVAIINNPLDFALAREKHWYRIPVSSVMKWLKDSWPPRWLAFYQTKVFGPESYAINYFSPVIKIKQRYRWQLFPNQPRDEKSDRQYFQVFIKPLQRLPRPIASPRFRRIIFVPTTWHKLNTAEEINDLYDDSPLENRLWKEFKQFRIPAIRQELIQANQQYYFLDFAIYCAMGNLDIETDGDVWHSNPDKAAQDNIRDNNLKTVGWNVLRFNSMQVNEEISDYCVPMIKENINRLGGVEEGKFLPRLIDQDNRSGIYQATLFDDLC